MRNLHSFIKATMFRILTAIASKCDLCLESIISEYGDMGEVMSHNGIVHSRIQ